MSNATKRSPPRDRPRCVPSTTTTKRSSRTSTRWACCPNRPSRMTSNRVEHSDRVGWRDQLRQLRELLETDPHAGIQALGGFILPLGNRVPDDRNPEFPDPIPNESTVLAQAIGGVPRMTCPTCGSEGPLATDTTCASCDDGLTQPLTEYQKMRREMLRDEIEMDML